MTAEEFYDKITHIVDDARTPDQSRIWSDEFYKELQEITRIKCLEAIKNTKNKAAEIQSRTFRSPSTTTNLIQTIPDQDVMPEL